MVQMLLRVMAAVQVMGQAEPAFMAANLTMRRRR